MRAISMFALAISIVGVSPGGAAAQVKPLDSAAVANARAKVRSDLRNIMTAQEAYFSDHSTYAKSLSDLGDFYKASKGVTIVVKGNGLKGHSATGTIDTVPGLTCAVFIGEMPPPLGTGKEAEVVCKGP